jgi:hypothetical protein
MEAGAALAHPTTSANAARLREDRATHVCMVTPNRITESPRIAVVLVRYAGVHSVM